MTVTASVRWTAFFLALSHCLAAFAESPSESVRKQLLEVVTPQVRVLSREVHLYHWAPVKNIIGDANPAELQPMDVRLGAYAHNIKETFWQLSTMSHGTLGDGLYAATEPVSTRGYGGIGGDWALLQFVPPVGTRVLNLATAPSFSEDLKLKLQTEGCYTATLEGLIFMGTLLKECKDLRDFLIRELDLQAVEYKYDSASFDFCEKRPQVAFILIDDRAINSSRLVGFRAVLPSSPDAHSENRLLLEFLLEHEKSYVKGASFWPSLQGVSPKMGAVAWSREHIFGCGGYSEDR